MIYFTLKRKLNTIIRLMMRKAIVNRCLVSKTIFAYLCYELGFN